MDLLRLLVQRLFTSDLQQSNSYRVAECELPKPTTFKNAQTRAIRQMKFENRCLQQKYSCLIHNGDCFKVALQLIIPSGSIYSLPVKEMESYAGGSEDCFWPFETIQVNLSPLYVLSGILEHS